MGIQVKVTQQLALWPELKTENAQQSDDRTELPPLPALTILAAEAPELCSECSRPKEECCCQDEETLPLFNR